MRLVLANHSTYPRVGEGAAAQRLRRAYADRETGKIDDTAFADVVDGYVGEVIAEQEATGIDVVTDGAVYAYDVVSHPASRLAGVKIGGLVRFFDTNTYVRQPEVDGTPTGTFGLARDFARADRLATKQLKVVVTGPYTLARHSIMGGDADLPRVAMAYAEALAADLEELNGAGATLVQIDEPSLLRNPGDAEMVRSLLMRALQTKGDITVALTTYFGDATPLYGELVKMPADIVGFDLAYGPGVVDAICTDPPDRPVALGIVDGRNTKPEDVDAAAATIARVVDALEARGIGELHLQPSCGLEFLPRDRAERKLKRLHEIAHAVLETVS